MGKYVLTGIMNLLNVSVAFAAIIRVLFQEYR